MPDYNNGKIYKLWSPEGDDIYIGSTVNSLARRKAGHKRSYITGKPYSSKILFEKYEDIRIELIEEFSCENKMELDKREGHYIRTLECVNKRVAGRTKKEYRHDNKEEIKEYLEKNKEKIKEQKQEWYEKNNEQIKERTKKYYEEHKQYYKDKRTDWCEKNREKIKEEKKIYHEKHKEYFNQKRRERLAKKKNLDSVQSVVLSPEQPTE